MVLGLPFDQVWVPGYTSFHPSVQAKVSYMYHRDQLCVIQSLTVIFSVSRLAKIVYINGHKKWIQAAMNMKHAVNDSWFPIISVHINISKLRSGPKWPLFSNPLTYSMVLCAFPPLAGWLWLGFGLLCVLCVWMAFHMSWVAFLQLIIVPLYTVILFSFCPCAMSVMLGRPTGFCRGSLPPLGPLCLYHAALHLSGTD